MEFKTILYLISISFQLVIHLTRICCDAKTIVFFPVSGSSHIRYHTNVARAVGELGHNAWVCIPEELRDKGEVDLSGINALYYGETLGPFKEKILAQTKIHDRFWENATWTPLDMVRILATFDELALAILKEGLSDKVKKLKPDLFVLDGVPFVRYLYVVPYKLNIPYAVIGSVYDMSSYRVPFSPAATPLQFDILNDRMDFMARLLNTFTTCILCILPYISGRDVVTMFVPEKPHKALDHLVAGAEVFITELDPILDYPKPMLPNTKLIGGTVVKNSKPLKEPFKSFIDRSNNGIIVISFGTTIIHVPTYVHNKIHEAAKASGLNVVWRSDQPSSDPKRFLLSDWLPQNDILGHPNTKMFISHCGKNGQYEALFHGLPILCLPIFGDQPYNAERIRSKGYGLKADMRYATTEELTGMVQELITNTTYKNNMVKASKLFRLLYKSPMKEAAFWLDHVMEYGGDYMRASSQRMPLYQYLMLDILAVMCVVVLVVIFVFFIIIRSCVRLICATKKMKSKSE